MVTISIGNKKKSYPSIKAYADAHGIKYITVYMRLRFGVKPATAVKKPIRKYEKKVA